MTKRHRSTRRRTEDAKELPPESEHLYRVLAENTSDMITLHLPDGTFLYVSPACRTMLGYEPEDLVGTRAFDLMHPDDVERIRGIAQRAVATGVHDVAEYRHLTKDGRYVWVEVSGKVVRNQDTGDITDIICIVRDITERKRAEGERARLAMAIEHAAEAVVVTDSEGIIEYVNPAFEQITGYTREEAIGRNPRILNSGKQDKAFYVHLWGTITRGEVWSGRFTNMRKDGRLYEEEGTISPVLDAAGKIVSYVAIKRDISDRLALERRMRQAQKMEAIGTLAGGIAHDFNNVLAAIIGYGELAASELDPGTHLRRDLDYVLCAADRAKDLVRQILTFSRRAEEERKPVDLGMVVKEALKLLRPSLPSTIEIHTRIEEDRGLVLADPTQAHQVLMNLCTNAYHAMRETGGTLSVSVEPFLVDSLFTRLHPGLKEGPYVRLSVSDTGCGMDPETLERVFEPFFTTKTQDEGTGLGLATAHGIISAHGGVITVYSEVGKGTLFHVYLPRAELGPPGASLSEESVLGGQERILVVDDEKPLVDLMETTLSRFGYDVVTATSSQDALAAFAARPQGFDLILTDQTMPKMTGEQLAAEVWRIRPEMRVILTTGFTGGALNERLANRGVSAILRKPMKLAEMARVVRRVLDGCERICPQL